MALLTLGPRSAPGASVTGGKICIPRIGAWHADLTVDSSEEITGAVALQLGDQATLLGTVSRSAVYEGMVRAFVVAGGNGLRKTVQARHFHRPAFRTVLDRVASDVGEAVSATASSTILGAELRRWSVLADQTAGRVIQLLVGRAAPADTAWRLLADGTIWVGPETWPEAEIGAVVVSETPEEALLELGLDQPLVSPGTTFNGRRVDYVEIEVGAGSLRARVWAAA